MGHDPVSTVDHISPGGWDDAVAAANPASLLLVIEDRMGPALRERMGADDILQDSLLHAWRDRHSFKETGLRRFRNWLLSIIDHRIGDARDHAAAMKRGGGVRTLPLGPAGTSDGPVLSVPTSTTPSRVAWYREQAAAIRAAIESLPDDLRPVVRLRLVEQLQVERIAEQLGIGPSAVRHRFRRGAEMLQSRLTSLLGTRAEAAERADSAARRRADSSP